MNDTPTSDRYHQLVFLWFTDRPKFRRYAESVAPIVGPYGAGLERRFEAQTVHGHQLERPDVINFVYYTSRDAYQAFTQDEAFRRIVHLRSESTRLLSVEGPSIRGDVGSGDPTQRLYLIEIAKYGPGGVARYETYEKEAESVLEAYGYHVERKLRPDTSSGLPFSPDVVKIAYFDAADGMERMHRDPAHARLENELYPAAVADSIWVVGKAALD